MSARKILLQAAAIRAAYGVAAIAAPEPLGNAARLPLDPDARYFNALFGGRDLTVAAMLVASVRAGRIREAAWINASCELTDAVSVFLEYRRRGRADGLVKAAAAFSVAGQIGAVRALLDR